MPYGGSGWLGGVPESRDARSLHSAEDGCLYDYWYRTLFFIYLSQISRNKEREAVRPLGAK